MKHNHEDDVKKIPANVHHQRPEYDIIINCYNMKHGQRKITRCPVDEISWASEHRKGLQTSQPWQNGGTTGDDDSS